MNKSIKRNDIILIIAVLFVAIVLLVTFKLNSKKGETIVVTVNGSEYASYDLSEDIRENIQIKGVGENLLVIENKEAFIVSADCPDKVCVSHKKISKVGESIVCLPHRLVVSVESK